MTQIAFNPGPLHHPGQLRLSSHTLALSGAPLNLVSGIKVRLFRHVHHRPQHYKISQDVVVVAAM